MSEATFALGLESFVPPKCDGCETARAVCFRIARQVTLGEVDASEAGAKTNEDIARNCSGKIMHHAGWGSTSMDCGYSEKKLQ